MFSTPKARRLHLIQAHGYPKEYFFAVTNKGIGGLLKKWGEGASMIRGEWKPRDLHEDADSEEDGNEADRADESTMDTPNIRNDTLLQSATGPGKTATNEPSTTATPGSWMADAPLVEEDSDGDGGRRPATREPKAREGKPSEDSDALVGAMSSLSLVPATVRFGRGASRGGFTHGAGVAHQRAASRDSSSHPRMDVDGDKPSAAAAADALGSVARSGRGRGGNARGQARAGARPESSTNTNFTDAAEPDVVVPRATRPPMPPRGLGRGTRGRFPGRARILFNAGRGRGL